MNTIEGVAWGRTAYAAKQVVTVCKTVVGHTCIDEPWSKEKIFRLAAEMSEAERHMGRREFFFHDLHTVEKRSARFVSYCTNHWRGENGLRDNVIAELGHFVDFDNRGVWITDDPDSIQSGDGLLELVGVIAATADRRADIARRLLNTELPRPRVKP